MRALAFDPDLHNTGWALVEKGASDVLHVRDVGCIKVPTQIKKKKTKGEWAVRLMSRAVAEWDRPVPWIEEIYVVEGQQIYFGKTPNPQNIVHLAQVAGACLAWSDCEHTYLPSPSQWKGSVEKHIHQARICKKLGWDYEIRASGKNRYAVPTNAPFSLKATEWKHCMDAIGLAIWGLEKRR